MPLSLTPRVRADLRSAVQAGLEYGFRSGRAIARGRKHREIDFVVGLLHSGVPVLDRRLRAALRPAGLTCRIAGVYCHGSPIVELDPAGSGRRCEIADLLVVVVQRGPGGTVISRRAQLQQFKLDGSSGPTPAQYELYDHWTDFRYFRAAKRSFQGRRVRGKRPHAGAKFVTVTACPCGFTDAQVRMPTDPWSSLIEELASLVVGDSGRPFERLSSTTRALGWNRVIDDLLRTTACRLYRYQRAHGNWTMPARAGARAALAYEVGCVVEPGDFHTHDWHAVMPEPLPFSPSTTSPSAAEGRDDHAEGDWPPEHPPDPMGMPRDEAPAMSVMLVVVEPYEHQKPA
jgi:hypothetical protein